MVLSVLRLTDQSPCHAHNADTEIRTEETCVGKGFSPDFWANQHGVPVAGGEWAWLSTLAQAWGNKLSMLYLGTCPPVHANSFSIAKLFARSLGSYVISLINGFSLF